MCQGGVPLNVPNTSAKSAREVSCSLMFLGPLLLLILAQSCAHNNNWPVEAASAKGLTLFMFGFLFSRSGLLVRPAAKEPLAQSDLVPCTPVQGLQDFVPTA